MSGSDDDGLIKLDAGDEEGVFSDEDEDDLLPFHGFDEPAAAAAPRGKKRAAGDEEEAEAEEAAGKSKAQLQRAERKKRKAAPMFASAEDYAHLIDNNDGEDMA
jgi:ribosome biogenesis protein MAK21